MARRGSGYVRWMNDDWQLFVGGISPTHPTKIPPQKGSLHPDIFFCLFFRLF